MHIMVLYNDKSGKSAAFKLAEDFQQFAQKIDNQTVVFLQPFNQRITKIEVQNHADKHKIDTIVAVGGDGTINHMIDTFKESIQKYKIGIIPAGTVNNFAQSVNIPMDNQKAFETILFGVPRGVDYGLVNKRVIISTMTIGLLADTAMKITQEEKQKLGAFAFIKRFFKVLSKKKRYKLEIVTPQKTWRGKAQLLTVFMSNSVGGYTNFDEFARPDDGLFHLILLPQVNLLQFIGNISKIIHGKITEIPELIAITADTIQITSKEKVFTRTDGDPTDPLPIQMKIKKRGLNVLVPVEHSKNFGDKDN